MRAVASRLSQAFTVLTGTMLFVAALLAHG
jgi:hypothetical protein